MEMTQAQLTALVENAVKNFIEAGAFAPPKPVAETVVAPSQLRADVRSLSTKEAGLGFGRVMRALIGGGGTVAGARNFAQTAWGDGEDSIVQKLLIVGSDPSGGFLVPDELSNIFIDLLMPYSVVRNMGPTVLPMPSGNLSLNGGLTGPTAYYIGETDAIPPSSATFRRVNLSAKKLVALVPISNDLIRTSSPKADAVVSKWLFQTMANREDLAFIRGDGAVNTPQGLLNLGGNTTAQTGVTVANVATDLALMKLAMRQANLNMTNPGFLMSPRSESFLENLKDGTNGWPYRESMTQGKVGAYPYAVTTQIPETLGGGTESEVYFVNFDDVIIGDTMNVKMDVSSEASYVDGATTRSAFQNDLTLLRTIAEHDINVQHTDAIYVLTGVTWGA